MAAPGSGINRGVGGPVVRTLPPMRELIIGAGQALTSIRNAPSLVPVPVLGICCPG
jgi:hypothetical protein